jgi:hypothetical protein
MRCLLLGGTLALVLLLRSAPAAEASCTGPVALPAGHTGVHLEGSAGPDVLCGSEGPDSLNGNQGNDELNGFGSADVLSGGEGNDNLFGGAGKDTLRGEAGEDHLDGGPEDDLLQGGSGSDTLEGGSGNDILVGGDGNDVLNGGPGSDSFDGGEGNDVILMRDGVGEEIPHCGGGTDRVDMDLRDNEIWLLNAVTTFGLSLVIASCETVNVGAVNEGPNVVISSKALRIGKAGRTGIRLQCPAALDIRCAGTLILGLLEKSKKKRNHPVTHYSLAPGASGIIGARLSPREQGILRAKGRVRAWILSVEKGHFGDKTTLQTVALRA